MTYITESTDLNESTFNEDNDYHIIPSFGSNFYSVEMIRDRIGEDLIEVLAFQTSFAEEVYKGLEAHFQDNGELLSWKNFVTILERLK